MIPLESSDSVITLLLKIQMELEEQGGEDGVLLDEDDVVDNLLVFLVAGHETGKFVESECLIVILFYFI